MYHLITRGDLILLAVDSLIEEAYIDEIGVDVDAEYHSIVKTMVSRVNDLLDSPMGEMIRLGWSANQSLLDFEEPMDFCDVIEQRLTKACSLQVDALLSLYETDIIEIMVVSPHFDLLIEFRS